MPNSLARRWLAAAALLLTTAASAAAPAEAPFLWQVQGPKTTHYLLGSVHLLPKAVGRLPTGIQQAFNGADGLVFESDIDALSAPENTRLMLDAAKAPRGLKAEIPPGIYALVQARVRQLGMPPALCEGSRPWFCALSLELYAYQRAGFRGEFGLDRQLHVAAERSNKPQTWFEPPAVHLRLFTNMPVALSKQFLEASVAAPTSKVDEPAEMFRAWRDNDTARIEGLVAEMKRDYPAIYEHLLAGRNRAWLPMLKTILDGPKRQLIVVGAAHWVGPDGLLASLSAAGYRVTPFLIGDPDALASGSAKRHELTAGTR